MGKLSFHKDKFYFEASRIVEAELAQEVAFKYDEDTLRWVSRSYVKAHKLRRYADESAEQKFKKYFITRYAPPKRIVYASHLRPKVFQLESAMWALSRSSSYIADEAGLGKTITSILCMNTVPGKVLVICPPYLKYNWKDECDKWLYGDKEAAVIEGGKSKEILFNSSVVILPDSLVINKRIQDILHQHKFEWLFVDEAHRYKEATTQRTNALVGNENEKTSNRNLASLAKRIVLLSGTPIPNGRPIELFPIINGIAPSAIGHRNLVTFGRKFCDGKQVTRYEGKRAVTNWDFSGSSNLKELKRELRDSFMIRHLKKDVLASLGPKTRKIIFLDQPDNVKEYEKRVLKNYTLDELMGEDHELGDIAAYRRAVGQAKILPAFIYLQDLLEASSNKLVVFAHHIQVVEDLTRMLSNFKPLMIRGGLSSKEKSERVKLFQTRDDHRVIVGNMESMGTGNTLTKSPIVAVVEPSWNPGVNEQAEDRVHRMTQDSNVYIHYLVLRRSLDERMLTGVLDKQSNINEVMG